MLNDPTFWVATSFIAFLLLIFYFKLPQNFAASLDARSAKIQNDLNNAEALCNDAQDLLATYQKKQRDATQEVKTIALEAEKEALQIRENGRQQIKKNAVRREKLVMFRFQQAEVAAIEKIRLQTVDIVIEATRNVIERALTVDKIDKLNSHAIKELPKSFPVP